MAAREPVTISFDPSVNALTVWFGDPATDYTATQVADDLILMRDAEGTVLGMEKHFFAAAPGSVQVLFETLPFLNEAELLAFEEPAPTS